MQRQEGENFFWCCLVGVSARASCRVSTTMFLVPFGALGFSFQPCPALCRVSGTSVAHRPPLVPLPPSHHFSLLLSAVGRSQWLRRKPQHHPNVPGVQRLRAQPEQLAPHHVHQPAWSSPHLHRDALHCAGLQQPPQRPWLLQGDLQPLLLRDRLCHCHQEVRLLDGGTLPQSGHHCC